MMQKAGLLHVGSEVLSRIARASCVHIMLLIARLRFVKVNQH